MPRKTFRNRGGGKGSTTSNVKNGATKSKGSRKKQSVDVLSNLLKKMNLTKIKKWLPKRNKTQRIKTQTRPSDYEANLKPPELTPLQRLSKKYAISQKRIKPVLESVRGNERAAHPLLAALSAKMKESAKKTPKFTDLNELTVALDNVLSPEEQKQNLVRRRDTAQKKLATLATIRRNNRDDSTNNKKFDQTLSELIDIQRKLKKITPIKQSEPMEEAHTVAPPSRDQRAAQRALRTSQRSRQRQQQSEPMVMGMQPPTAMDV